MRIAAVACLHTCTGRPLASCRQGVRPAAPLASPTGPPAAAPLSRPSTRQGAPPPDTPGQRCAAGPQARPPRFAPSPPTGGLARKSWSKTRVDRKDFFAHTICSPQKRVPTPGADLRPTPPHPLATTTRPRDTAGPAAQAQSRHAGARKAHTDQAGLPPATTSDAHARDHAGPPATTLSPARTTPRTSRPTRRSPSPNALKSQLP